jgi:hypothetical protein
MAGSRRLWESVVSQAGAISVGDIEELVDVAVGLYFTPVICGRRTAVAQRFRKLVHESKYITDRWPNITGIKFGMDLISSKAA